MPADGLARDRAGFTLIELIVTILILCVGVMALAVNSAALMRQTGETHESALAGTVAEARLERLRQGNCATITSGADTTGAVADSWTVSSLTGANTAVPTKLLSVSVTYHTTEGVARTQLFTTVRQCP